MTTTRHFLQIPGPSPVPDRILGALSRPVIDHRGPEFARLGTSVLQGMKRIFQSAGPVMIYPSSGTGAWEAAIVNTLSPGDRVLMVETGHFASLWRQLAKRFGIEVELIPSDWRRGIDALQIEERLVNDAGHTLKAVMVVHNETSTGATSDIAAIRAAMDRAGHAALLMVDTISSLGSVDYRHDDWRVDVSVGCSQKGLMLPPGLGFVAVSDKALEASRHNGLQRSYWDWAEMLKANAGGAFPYTPATNLLYGLNEAIAMLEEEGLAAVFARHRRLAAAARAAVEGWGLEVLCREPEAYSPVLTGVVLPEGHDADRVRGLILERFNMSLGAGLGRLAGKIFRIGHLGACDPLTLLAAVAGVELGLAEAGVPIRRGGVTAAMASLEKPGND